MSQLFRLFHLKKILHEHEESSLPLDVIMGGYFRRNKAVGSKDKRFISDTIYEMVRWKALIDACCAKPISWESRLDWYLSNDPLHISKTADLPAHTRVSFPQHYFQLLSQSYGEEKALEFCLVSNEQAPTTVRVNALKTTRDALMQKWNGVFEVANCAHAENGIRFHKKINFFILDEFKEGFFEVQDEASQLVADLVNAAPGMKILDFCAGAGGKTLAFAPKMNNKGVVYVHDIRESALKEAKRRLQKAGIQNVQFCLPGDLRAKNIVGKMDAILLDVPCSGSGTLRRNPDLKWKFELSQLENLVAVQRKIFDEAFAFLKPGGVIIYTTCSILPQENQEQVRFFEENYPCTSKTPFFQSLPKTNEMDGFFGAVLSKKC